MSHPPPKQPSYLQEMILHPTNGYLALGSVLAGALLSFPFGVGIGLLPVIGFAAGEGIASLFVPSHPRFREWVDKKYRTRSREEARAHLEEELLRRVPDEDSSYWLTYERMQTRIDSLTRMAAKQDTQLSPRDVEALDDASVKFLGYWLAMLTIADRRSRIDTEALVDRLQHIEAGLEAATSRSERARLQKTQSDLEALIRRRSTLQTRQAEVETAMLTMADALEEVFQQVVSNPNGPQVGTQLREAAERMRAEEALDHAIDDELDDFLSSRPQRPASAKKKKKKRAVAAGQ